MAISENIPLNEEHMEAIQSNLDEERYSYVASLTDEEKKNFKTMEECVEKMVGTGRPFIFLMAAENRDDKFWRYQSFTKEKIPLSNIEQNLVMKRAWYAMHNHAKFFSQLTGHNIAFSVKNKPYFIVTPDKDYSSDAPL